MVTLYAVVSGTKECRFSSTNKVKGLPAEKGCAHGYTQLTVTVPANAALSPTTYEFELTVRNAAGTPITKHVKVVEQPSQAPHITVEPKSQRADEGTYVTFAATASGTPTPSGSFEVSTDHGVRWANIPHDDFYQSNHTVKVEVLLDGFGVTFEGGGAIAGDAGSFGGWEYRAVFKNAAGSATSRPAMLTALTSKTESFAGYTDFAPSAAAYHVEGGGFTSASADWVVPTINCAAVPSGETTWAAQWPGVGENNDVVQDGTIEGCLGTTVRPDAAWYEMLGDPAVNSGGQVELPIAKYPVVPGDHIAASVKLVHSIWTLAVKDSTQGWVFSISNPDTTPPLDESVAQVFTESSIGEVANFGATTFTAATATLNGVTRPLGAFLPVAVAMYATSTPLDLPGPLDSTGEKFTDTSTGAEY
jgi:hypothetical protein